MRVKSQVDTTLNVIDIFLFIVLGGLLSLALVLFVITRVQDTNEWKKIVIEQNNAQIIYPASFEEHQTVTYNISHDGSKHKLCSSLGYGQMAKVDKWYRIGSKNGKLMHTVTNTSVATLINSKTPAEDTDIGNFITCVINNKPIVLPMPLFSNYIVQPVEF